MKVTDGYPSSTDKRLRSDDAFAARAWTSRKSRLAGRN